MPQIPGFFLRPEPERSRIQSSQKQFELPFGVSGTQSTHQKHYISLARSAFALPKMRIQPRTERAKPHILAHALTAREAAEILDCTPGDIEVLIERHTLVGRNLKTTRGHLWIVCAACIADFQSLTPEVRNGAIAKAWGYDAEPESD